MGVCPRSSSPGHLRMVLRTSLRVIIILTLLVIASGSIPKTNSGSEVAGDHLNVGDINLDSYGVRDIVKRDADGNAGERNAKPNKTTKPNVSKINRNKKKKKGKGKKKKKKKKKKS